MVRYIEAMNTADTLARVATAIRKYATESAVAIRDGVEGPETFGLADRIVVTLGIAPVQLGGVVSDRPWIQIHDTATQFRLITKDPDCDPALLVAVISHQLAQTPTALHGETAWAAGIDEIENAYIAAGEAVGMGPMARGGEQKDILDMGKSILSMILRGRPYFALVAGPLEMGVPQPHLPAVETVSVVVESVLRKALQSADSAPPPH